MWNYPSNKRGNKMANASLKRGKILVVEDEPVISRICMRTLTGEGFEVDIAANGSLAEGMLKNKEYNLILIDIRTPVMNGKQLYRSINDNHPDLADRVIFTTGDLLAGDTKSFLEQSGRLFLPKPFTPDELKTAIKKAMGQLEK